MANKGDDAFKDFVSEEYDEYDEDQMLERAIDMGLNFEQALALISSGKGASLLGRNGGGGGSNGGNAHGHAVRNSGAGLRGLDDDDDQDDVAAMVEAMHFDDQQQELLASGGGGPMHSHFMPPPPPIWVMGPHGPMMMPPPLPPPMIFDPATGAPLMFPPPPFPYNPYAAGSAPNFHQQQQHNQFRQPPHPYAPSQQQQQQQPFHNAGVFYGSPAAAADATGASSAAGEQSSVTAAAAVPSVMSVLQPHSTSLRTLSASNSSSSSSSVYDINLAGSDCRFFFEQSCNKGTQCVYRHCAAARHTTQVCTGFAKSGQCASPQTCSLRHTTGKPQSSGVGGMVYYGAPTSSHSADAPTTSSQSSQPCSYFAKGTCAKGANCAFLHIARPTAADNAAATAALAANNGQAPPVAFDVSETGFADWSAWKECHDRGLVWDGASADWQRVLALNAGEIEFFRTAMASEAKFSMPEYNRFELFQRTRAHMWSGLKAAFARVGGKPPAGVPGVQEAAAYAAAVAVADAASAPAAASAADSAGAGGATSS